MSTEVILPAAGFPNETLATGREGSYTYYGSMRAFEFLDKVKQGGPDVPRLASTPPPAELAELRTGNNLSQAQVADLLGCSVARVQGYEDGSMLLGADGETLWKYVYGTMRALINIGKADGGIYHS